MISDLRLGFRLLRYAHNLKFIAVMGTITTLLGIGMCSLDAWQSEFYLGGYFTMLFAFAVIQTYGTLKTSAFVQVSPHRKKLQTSVPAVLNLFCMSFGYLIVVLTEAVIVCVRPAGMKSACITLLVTAVFMGFVIVYGAYCVKYYFFATLLFIAFFTICYCFLMGYLEKIEALIQGGWSVFALISALGLVGLWVCAGLHYLIALAVYRKPASKYAQCHGLRKYM
ncbi:MAG: hypothetical protein ACI4TA_07100 [Acetatifactor sp.]